MLRRFVFLALVLQFASAVPAGAQGPLADPVQFRPGDRTTLMIEGTGPFRGSLEVRRVGGSLTVINALTLDEYVMGVREVPGMWPMEALKAQAVAARTYALWEKRRGHWQQYGYDICGSTACQVYQGAEAEAGERGRRWAQAVRETAGEVLVHDGEPALARYHASSGGQTLDNEFVYPSAGPRPYLQGVVDDADEVSPLHTWTVRFTREELAEILREGFELVGTIDEVVSDQSTREVTITTLGGELVKNTPTLRRVISDVAPRLYPDRFPSLRDDGERLPLTLPSSRFDVVESEDGFEFRGRGYGHGVGMSQWGAMGRAEQGATYDEILRVYYSGLGPTQAAAQETVRVPVVEGAEAVRILGDGTFGVGTGTSDLAASTLGGWSVSVTGERSLQVTPPEGFDLPLVLTGVRAPEELLIDPPESGTSVDVDFVVPKPAEVVAVLSRQDGEEVARERVIVEAGERQVRIPLDPDELGGRHTYDVSIEAFDGTERVTDRLEVVLDRPGASLVVWAASFAALALAGLLVFWWRRGRWA